MGACPYLQPADYAAFGIPDAQPWQVDQASRRIDAHLGRPEGLLWSADANGQPAWMTGLTPSRSFPLPAALTPGSNVQITVPFGRFTAQTVGEVVVLDRTNPLSAEACVVTAAAGNTLTLATVQFPHNAQAAMEFGLTVLFPSRIRGYGRRAVRLPRQPLVQILSGVGRYGYDPRATDRGVSVADAVVGGIAVQPWTAFDLSNCAIDYDSGTLALLPGTPQGGFNEVTLRYVAGWQYATLPEAVKRAAANLVRTAAGSADLPANARLVKAGDATIERFGTGGTFDADTLALLQPYASVRI